MVLLGALYLLGVVWGDTPDDGGAAGRRRATPTATATPGEDRQAATKKKKKAAPARVIAAADGDAARVYVCLVDATGKAVVNGEYLEPGKSTKTFRSQRFRVNFGNGDVRMSVGGKRYTAANIGKPIGYEVRPGKKPTRLSESRAPGLCAT